MALKSPSGGVDRWIGGAGCWPLPVFSLRNTTTLPGEGEMMGAFLVQEGLLLATWWVEAVGYRGDWFDGSSPKIKNMPPPPIGSVVL